MYVPRVYDVCVFISKDIEEKTKALLLYIFYIIPRSYIFPHVIVTKWQVAGVQFNFEIFINFVDIFQITAHFKVFYI